MRVLVSGNKGYIGSVLISMLAKNGHSVTGLDIDLYERCSFGSEPEEFFTIKKDIRDVEAKDLAGFDAVVHLAALSNDPLSNLNPEITFDINHRGTIHLASQAKRAGVKRFLFSSSCSNYGSAGDQMVTEEAQLNPVTAYGISKVKAEQDLADLASDDFSPTFLRSATAYGVSPRHRFDIVLNNLTAWAFTTGKIMLKSDGTPWRPIVHIEDISQAFIAVLNAPREKVHNQAFNVGRTEENYRIREIAEIVKDVMPSCRLEFSQDAGPDARCYRVDMGKIKKVLPEFKPQWTARSGAEQLYKAYKLYKISLDEFEGPKFKRIDHLKLLLRQGLLDETLRWCSRDEMVSA
jgi:nucleoside-diphosphate-sugar epimerase